MTACALTLLLLAAPADGTAPDGTAANGTAADAPTGAPLRRALLVGVGRYEHLSEAEQLDGCGNDVALMRRLLEDRFGFAPAEIRTLSDGAATGAAIRAALGRIAAEVAAAGRPAEVVFHFSGHGSQLADQPGPGADEADGLDETLVPADATRQGGPADIRDDELFAFAQAVCAGGRGRLWMVLDCCHSGTAARGAAPLARVRKLDRAVTPAAEVGAAAGVRGTVAPRRLPAGAVALYACRDRELEPEYREGGQSYGLLTRFLTRVIAEHPRPAELTHGGLCELIAAAYRRDRRLAASAPSPAAEADAARLDAPLLGGAGRPRPRAWPVVPSGRGATVRGGAFHGFAAGTVFELYDDPLAVRLDPADPADPAAASGDSAGWLRLTTVEAADSRAEFVRWDGGEVTPVRPPRDFRGGLAVARRRETPGPAVRLLVGGGDAEGDAEGGADLAAAVRAVAAGAVRPGETAWVEVVSDGADADLVLRGDRRRLGLAPPFGLAAGGAWGPFDADAEEFGETLADALRRFARVRNLIRLASAGPAGGGAGGGRAGGGGRPIDVSVELLRVPDLTRPDETEPWPVDRSVAPPAPVMRTGDAYSYRITNRSAAAAHVAALHLNSDLGIEQILPYQDEEGLHGVDAAVLPPGGSRTEGPFVCNGSGAPGFGPRHAVVLATAEPNRFYMLAQDALPIFRSANPGGGLAALLNEAMYFRGRRRPAASHDDSWGTCLIRWRVLDADEPAGGVAAEPTAE